MKEFDFKSKYNKLLLPEIVGLVSQIHEFKGRQASLQNIKQDVLTQLVEVAKIQSTEASNKIEGIVTTSERLRKIVREKTMPRTRNEKEIAGYRDVLSTIHESFAYIPPKPAIILQLHRDLYKFTGKSIGGNYKNSDNIIAEERDDERIVRFQPIHAWETPDAIKNLCDELDKALNDPEMDSLIVISMFILDFLCIHPFNDGNGRMSRLLTLLLLYRAGYDVGKYISIEKIISDSKETYYEVLQESSYGWHEGENDYEPFVRYMLGTVIAAYREFSNRVEIISVGKLNKASRVREIIKNTVGQISKADILENCPDISEVTVERSLKKMLTDGEIIKIGGGRYTKYVWNHDKE